MTERAHPLHLFFAISLGLHVIVFWQVLLPFLGSLEVPSLRPVIEIVELPRIARARRPAESALSVPAPPPPREAAPSPEVEPAPPPSAEPFRDVVEIPKPAVEEKPRDTRILSRYNQRVERPARARDLPIDNRGDISERRTADPLAPPAAAQTERRAAEARPEQSAQEAQARAVAGGGRGESAAEKPGTPGAAERPRPVRKGAIFRSKAGDGGDRAAEAGPAGLGEGLRDLLPTQQRLAQLAAAPEGGRSNPYNPDLVPVDARMSMDTLKSENVGYFLAVKKRLALNWDPARLIRAASYDYNRTVQNFGPGNAASSARNALISANLRTGRGTTIVRFKIAKNGRLAGEPRIARSSGSAFLDEEAVRAVRLGDPFPPVPDRLAQGSLTIDWGFIYGRR
jgi:TonB family protein